MPKRTARRRGGGLLVALLLGALAGFAGYEAATWPDVAGLVRHNPRTTAFIERYRAAHPQAAVRWTWVSYAAISPDLPRAVLVAEDINFFSHHGFAVEEIGNAVNEAIEEREVPRGASTLTQQTAKNLWLSPSRNPWRKAKEAILTWQLERDLSKRRILEIYLNVAELGPGIFGAEAAARTYFGCSAAALGPHQAAALAAGLPKPDRWHPGSSSTVYRRRVERIERRMEKAAWLRKVVR